MEDNLHHLCCSIGYRSGLHDLGKKNGVEEKITEIGTWDEKIGNSEEQRRVP